LPRLTVREHGLIGEPVAAGAIAEKQDSLARTVLIRVKTVCT